MKKCIVAFLTLLLSISIFAAGDGYIINEVEFKNLREIPQSVIVKQMQLKKGGVFNTKTLVSDFNKLKSNSYISDVSITPEVIGNSVKLVVDVKEKRNVKKLLEKQGIIPMSEIDGVNKSVRIASLEIIGSVNVSLNEVLKKIPVKVGGYFSRNKIIEGQRALLDTGMYKEVIPDIYQYPEGLTVVYSVIENPIVRGINISGNTIYTREELQKLIDIKPGKILNFNDLRKTRDKILKKYNDDGYTLTKIENIDISPNNKIDIVLNEGRISFVDFKKMITKHRGNRREAGDTLLKTQDYLIEREIEIKPGEVFNINKYNKTSTNLMRTGLFKNVQYQADDMAGNDVGLTLLLEEEGTASLRGAISYGTESGILGMLEIGDRNWKGRGQDLNLKFEKSDEDYSSFSLSFSDPWIKDTDRISWGWSIYRNEYQSDDSILFYETERYGIDFNVGKGLTSNLRLGIGTKLEYIFENSQEGILANYPTLLNKWGPDRHFFLYSISPTITYDTRNNFWNPTKGFYAQYKVELGYSDSINSGFFANNTLELRTYHKGFFKKNIFAYRTILGMMTDKTPESQRYWVGGGSSLRGFDSGYFKGTSKFVATIENRTEINDTLGFVLFADAGRSWDYKGEDPIYFRDEKFGRGEIGVAAGVGLRINTPMGPLRFDFAWPMNSEDGKGMEFYFNMGQSF